MSKYAVFFTLKAEAIARAMQQPSDRVAVVSKAVGSCWPGQSIHHRVAPAELLPAATPASRQRHGHTPARAVRRLPVPLTHHSRSSSAASGPVPCSRYCRSPWL